MKNLLKTSLLAIMIAFTVACSKDDKKDVTNNPTTNTGNNGNNNPTPAQMIVGDWEMNGFDQDGDATSSGVTVYTYTMVGSNFSGLFSFKSDNTYENTTEYDIVMTMTIPNFGDQTINQTVNTSDSGTWTINSDGDLEVTSNSNNATQVMEIATISSNKLILKGSVSQQQTQGGMTATVTGNSTFSFMK